VPPGLVQNHHVEQPAFGGGTLIYPHRWAELIHRTAEPFIQVIVDLEVSRMAFGPVLPDRGLRRSPLRPHIGVGTAKAADDAWQLGIALQGVTAPYVPDRLKAWETQQLSVARRASGAGLAWARSELAGRNMGGLASLPPFGLLVPGDSVLPVAS